MRRAIARAPESRSRRFRTSTARTDSRLKTQIDALLARGLAWWVDGIRRRARATVFAIVLMTLGLAVYTALFLGIDSDNLKLIPAELPSRRSHEAFIEHFPNLEEAMFVVIDADTPELARDSAARLAAALEPERDVFTDVYLPGGGEFFDRNGLLYLTPDELDDFADQMARIQPLIAELEHEPTLAHMAGIVQEGLEAREPGDADQEDWRLVLDRVSEATVRAWDEYPIAVSWEEVLLRGSALDGTRRRAIVVHPVLEYEHILQARKPMARIRDIAERLDLTPERGVTVRITGNPALNYDEMIGFAWDIGGGSVFCLLLVAFVLHRALRSVRLVVAALTTLLVGLIWTAAFTAAAIGTLNPLSMTFAILFIGLGVDFGIHVCTAYADRLRSGDTHEVALRETAGQTGAALALCTLTTSIGFYVFIPTDYRGVSEMGLISGTGMFIIFGLTLTLLPALLCTVCRIDPARDLKASVSFERDLFAGFRRHPRIVRWTALALGIGGAIGMTGLRFDCNVVEMRDPDTESVQAFQDLLADPRATPWYLNVLMPDPASATALAERIETLPEVDQVITLDHFVPDQQDEKLEILADVAMLFEIPPDPGAPQPHPDVATQVDALRKLRDYLDMPILDGTATALAESMVALRDHLDRFLARVDRGDDPELALADLEHVLLDPLPDLLTRLRKSLQAEPFGVEDLPSDLVSRMRAPDGTVRVQIFPTSDMRGPDDVANFVRAVTAVTPNAAGVPLNLYEFGLVASSSFSQALVSAIVIISLLLLILWRRVRDVAVVMVPLLLGASLTATAAVLLDIRFNFTNVIVIPLLFGIGVDSAIHLLQRSQEGLGAGEHLTSTATARAVYYSAITTMVSFGSLALAGHNGVSSLGVMLTMGLVFTVLSVLIVLPALIEPPARDSSAPAASAVDPGVRGAPTV